MFIVRPGFESNVALLSRLWGRSDLPERVFPACYFEALSRTSYNEPSDSAAELKRVTKL